MKASMIYLISKRLQKSLLILTILSFALAANAQSDLKIAERNNTWDTITNNWQGKDSILYYYDGQNRVSSEIHFRFNAGTAGWDTVTRQTYSYHPTLGLLSVKNFFSYAGGFWDTTYRDFYQYDPDSSLYYYISYVYSGGNFVPVIRDEYYYNSYGNKVTYLRKGWNSSTATYYNQKKTVYHYNTMQQNDTVTDLSWVSSAWTNLSLNVFQYNLLGLISSRSSFTWYAGSWGYGLRWSYTYNTQGKIEQENVFVYQPGVIWQIFGKTDYYYLNDLYLQQKKYYLWDNANTTWNIWEETDYELNADNNTTDTKFYKFNTTAALLQLQQHTVMDYDSHGNYIHGYYAQLVNHLGVLRNVSETFDWYFLSATAVQDLQNEIQMVVYPNPVSDLVTIKFNLQQTAFVRIAVFNSGGSFVRDVVNREEGQGQVTVTAGVGDLPSGTYFIQTRTGATSKTQKIIITH